MDDNSIFARIALGVAVRIIGASIALYVASYAVIAFLDAAQRVSEALPK